MSLDASNFVFRDSILNLMRKTRLLTLEDSSTKSDPLREWMRDVSSDKSVEVEYMSLERIDAVLWKVRSSSVASAVEL